MNTWFICVMYFYVVLETHIVKTDYVSMQGVNILDL